MKKTYITLFLPIIILLFSACGRGKSHQTNAPSNDSTQVAITEKTAKPDINFYIENSGSMLGYINGVTEFEQILYNYLTDIEISQVANSLNLFYINEQTFRQPYDLKKYIGDVEPNSFASKNGTSDISDILANILSVTNDSTLSIFVSDCIFSPGKGISADKYLVNQQIEVKTNTANYLNKNKLAITIYQFNSKFNGRYYNRVDAPTTINDVRPFYVWILGNPKHVAELQRQIPDSKFIGEGVQHKASLSSVTDEIKYSILPTSGNFKLDKINPLHIIEAQKSTGNRSDKNKFTFIINADFSPYSLDKEYLHNANNYTIDNRDYSISLSDSRQNGYTTSIKLTTEQLQPTSIGVNLLINMPQWVNDMNDEEGLDIMQEGAMAKTFGIKYLIGGLYDAFTQKSNIYTTLKVNIDTK